MHDIDFIEILRHIPVSQLDYTEWIEVGMALKHEGYSCQVWDDWSQNDSRYQDGVCDKKWDSFDGDAKPVTGGTLIEFAKRFGYNRVDSITTFDWDDEIGVDKAWIEPEPIQISDDYEKQAVNEIITYLETLFQPDEKVGYVMSAYQDDDGKWKPSGTGTSSRTAGALINSLKRKKADVIGAELGDYNPEAGAWIRFNPLDGNGVKNENVTEYRYALVESDSLDLEMQNAIIKDLQLPVAALVYSGGKSIHAIVRIDAPTKEIYRERVDKLYKICDGAGLKIDKQNKNPSRLSRMPGIRRGDKWQHLISTNIGMPTWKAWEEYIQEQADTLPDPEDLFSELNANTQLAPEVIQGVLRQGRKMILTGASKAGKSFLLVELGMAMATGTEWLGFLCNENKVLYINFEIPKDSFTDRLRAVSAARGTQMSDYRGKFDCLSLRGHAEQFRKLLPSIKLKVRKGQYNVVILDPIYKTLLGDENDARVVAEFCNALDNLATETGVTIIFCHHHSKGAGEGMAAQNRSSGSGVFARDPDAIVDLLEISPVDKDGDPLEPQVEGLDTLRPDAFFMRIESSLREFAPINPMEIVFNYPAHYIVHGLENARSAGSARSKYEKRQAGRDQQTERKEKRIDRLIDYINNQVSLEGTNPTIGEAANYFKGEKGFSEPNIKKWVASTDGLSIKNGMLFYKDNP